MDTRIRIIKSAIELFMKSGIKGVTMNDIATSLGISKRTIYETFADKNELITACMSYVMELQNQFYEELYKTSDNVVDIFLKLIENGANYYKNNLYGMMNEIKRLYPVIFNNLVVQYTQTADCRLENLIKRGIQEEYICSNININLTTDLFQEHMKLLDANDLRQKTDYSFIEIYHTLIVIFFRGIATEKGIKYIDERLAAMFNKRATI